ncbi:hypothetical protein DL771_010025 [Monosporascus sp. 5C6A]|nr:hypothetical protein DL771_010025 [Monosporascus sp. 5C6A]
MRLLNVLTLGLEDFPNAQNRPPYVAMSHIWGPEEITYDDITGAREIAQQKQGYEKIQALCKLVRQQGLRYMFIDVCCLKNAGRLEMGRSAEFDNALNSMFNWFAGAELCFAHLGDLSGQGESALRQSRWFTRRWTLVEFLAARKLIFFNASWEFLGNRDDEVTKKVISEISGIDPKYFAANPSLSRRQTDMAYSMLGIFGVTMPIIYGEGGEAMTRLGILLISSVAESSYSSILGWADAIWLAARLGKHQLVHYLLENSAAPDVADWKGWTALHYAANMNTENVATDLLIFGANPNAQNETGETPLHLATKLGHDFIITLLLKHAADSSLTTKQGKTARDYASLESSRNIFAAPPIVEWTKVGHGKRTRLQLPPRPPREDERTICENFTAQVLYFGIDNDVVSQEITPSVYELIYREDHRPKRPERAIYQWIHLPLNHGKWVEDLIERLCYTDRKTADYCTEIKSFMHNHFYQRVATSPESRFRQPHFQIHYFDIESEDTFKTYKSQRDSLLSVYPDIYFSPTLDQSYHIGLNNTSDRDEDQVLTKALRKPYLTTYSGGRWQQQDEVSDSRQLMRLMVPQLWLWRIDKETVITCFPERIHGGDEFADRTLRNSIRRALVGLLRQPDEKCTPNGLVALMLKHSIGFFNDPANSGLDSPSTLWFARYIALQSEKEVRFRKTFLQSLKDRSAKRHVSSISKDIHMEVECLREIKDVRDEINMVKTILQNQVEVSQAATSSLTHQLRRTADGLVKTELESLLSKPDRTLEVLLQRWTRLDEDAARVEKSLNHLLDLKQKQANIDGAESASQEAKSSARQNKAILVFTIVTIIFQFVDTIVFVTSLYALDYFKPADGTQSVVLGWNQNDIGKGLGLAEGATIAVICIAIAGTVLIGSWNPFKRKENK